MGLTANEIMMGMASREDREPTPSAVEEQETVENNTEPQAQDEIQEEVAETVTEENIEEGGEEPSIESEETPEENNVESETPDTQGDVSGEDDFYSEWDSDEETPTEVDSTDVDFSSISNAIGIEGETNDKESFVKSVKDKFSSYEQKINDLSSNQMPENIPDSLKEAVKIAADGGDYSAYISVSTQDYDLISDVDLVANSIADHFVDASGKINEEELGKYLDDMSDKQLEIEATSIRSALKANRESQAQAIRNEASRKKNEMISSMKEALGKFDDFDGFKVMPHHKEIIMRDFTEDAVIKKMFYDKGQFSASKAMKSYFQFLYGGKIQKTLASKIKNQTKKQILEQVTNAQVDKPSSPPTPAAEERKVGMDAWMEQLGRK